MNKPWRTFCRPGTKFIEVYVFRGTMFYGASSISSYTEFEEATGVVSLQYVLDHLINGTHCKKCDKQMHFIDRVSLSAVIVKSQQ